MSVVSAKLSWRSKAQTRRNGETTRTDIWSVIATPPETGDVRNEIEVDSALPAYGSMPSDRNDIFVVGKDVREGGGPTLWEVVVSYSSIPNPDSSPEQDPAHPEYDPPSVEFIELQSTEVFEVDEDGMAIRNSSREPFDPPLQRTKTELAIAFTRNFTECTVTPAWLRALTDVVNDDTIAAFATSDFPGQGARGTVRIVGAPRAVWVRPNTPLVGHWRVSFTLLLRENPAGSSESDPEAPPAYAAHFRRVVDQGFREWSESDIDGTPIFQLIRSEEGAPLNQPTLLDGNGGQLAEEDPEVYLYFREFPEADFDPLQIVWPYCDLSSESASESGSESGA